MNKNTNLLENEVVEYESKGIMIRLTPDIVRECFCAKANKGEIYNFIKVCESQRLNPFLREVYLLKFDNKDAQIITGKDTFTKRAFQNPKFAGFQAGIIVLDKNGEIQYRNGSFKLKGETIAGGWCKVFIKGYDVTIDAEVSFDEYAKTYGTWKSIPATMIRKVALSQALREAFPEDLGGLYDSPEIGIEDEMLDETPVVTEQTMEMTGNTESENQKIYQAAIEEGNRIISEVNDIKSANALGKELQRLTHALTSKKELSVAAHGKMKELGFILNPETRLWESQGESAAEDENEEALPKAEDSPKVVISLNDL